MSRRFQRQIRVFLTVAILLATSMIGVTAPAAPIATQFFVPSDFSASLEVAVQIFAGNNSGIVESREVRGTNVSDSLSGEDATGPPGEGSDVSVSIGGTASLDLRASGWVEAVALPKPPDNEEVFGYGHVLSGIMNKFVVVPRSGFSGTEAFIQFEVLTQGRLFADIFDSSDPAYNGGSSVSAGVGFSVPDCPGCLGDYHFTEMVKFGDFPSGVGVSDHQRLQGYIPVNESVTVYAGLSIYTSAWAIASSPDGIFSGRTGAFFQNSLSFAVSSPDPVDIVWASDLFFDRQPSVSNQTPVPEPATMLLLGTGLVGLVGFGRKNSLKNNA